jgi:hypothetical protein
MKKLFTELDYNVAGGTHTVATTTRAGYDFRASWHYDDSPDTSWIGEFSDTPGEGAIEHSRNMGNTYKYFNPANPEYAEQEYKRMCGLNDGSWIFVGLKVTVFRAGIELGSASLWGIESDSDEAYFIETFNEPAIEALAEAEKNRKAIA